MVDGPCAGWAPDTANCVAWADHPQPRKDYALAFATYVLWAATGRQFGLCERTVRPCAPPEPALYRTYGVERYWSLYGAPGGGVVPFSLDASGCGCGSLCGCAPSQVTLPGPVESVLEVTVDGAALLEAGNWRVDGDILVRLGHTEVWPLQQDLALATTEIGTWSVRYQRGRPVPTVVNNAAGMYACEVARALAGGTCQLPARVQSVSRQGVDVQMLSTEDYLDQGLTGFEQVDMIIRAVNPAGLRARPRVFSPDLPQMR